MGVESAGLAYLVSSTPKAGLSKMEHATLPTVLSYIYDTALEQACDNNDVLFPRLVSSVEQHVSQFKSAGQETASSSSGIVSNGRLGPATVTVDRSSVCGMFGYSGGDLTLESLGNFSSCRANVAVYCGKWMYECTVLTSGIQQVMLFPVP